MHTHARTHTHTHTHTRTRAHTHTHTHTHTHKTNKKALSVRNVILWMNFRTYIILLVGMECDLITKLIRWHMQVLLYNYIMHTNKINVQ